MARPTLSQTRIAQGVWEGVLTGGGAAPAVEALHDGQPLPGVEVAALPGEQGHAVRVPLPGHILSEGVQVVLEVPRAQVRDVSRMMLETLPVTDFNIADIPVEEGIARLYTKGAGA